jgi:hypothetical protein
MVARNEPVWHPLLAAVETTPGHWVMLDGVDKPYGVIDLVKRGDELGYRANRVDATETVTLQVGYFRTLRTSAWEIHRAFLRAHGAPNRTSYGS